MIWSYAGAIPLVKRSPASKGLPHMKIAAAFAFATLATSAMAAAPQPSKPVSSSFFTGRWYEIARTDNSRQRGCEAPTYEFAPRKDGGQIGFVLNCRKGSPTGKLEATNGSVRLPTDGARNKFRISVYGGAIKQEYWVLDRADDLSWAIMATPGGNYVWLLARKPKLDTGLKTQLMTRIKAMGYDAAKIVQPRHG